jgi:hypothetical protein
MSGAQPHLRRTAVDPGKVSSQRLFTRLLGTDGINSVIVWLVLVAVLIVVRLAVYAFYPNAFNDPEQASFFGWPALALVGLLGLVGVYFAHLTGFPAAWSLDEPVRRWLAPIVIGLVFSAVYIGLDRTTGFTALTNAHHGVTTQFVGVVPSVLIFAGGAIISELVFRLFPIPVLLWLISRVALRKRWPEQIFWGLAILTSLLEPVSQYSFFFGSAVGVGVAVIAAGVCLNMVQAGFFRRYGFLSAIAVRFAFYMVWHVAYIH